jgi:HAD superfamily hydrolase (TIGR01509 family)
MIKELLIQKEGILFDMDGTLLDSEYLHAQSLNLSLENCDLKLSTDEFMHKFHGMADEDVFKSLFQIQSQEECNNYIEKKNQKLLELIEKLTQAEIQDLMTEGLMPLLKKLKSLNKKLAIVSASEPPIVDAFVRKCGMDIYFDVINSNTETFLGKPSASPYLNTMRALSLKTENTLIFEDSPTGLIASSLSGATVIKVTGHQFASHSEYIEYSTPNFIGLL